MSPTRIPLFPLSLVLFPGQAVPLHIFEPRYRVMTRQCIETRSPFGIVFVHAGNVAQTGCSALILKTLKEYDDGRSDILTLGQKVFHLIRTHNDQAYFEADVEFLSKLEKWPDDPFGTLQATHRIAFQRFSIMESSDFVDHEIMGRRWTTRRVMRRMLEHEFEHYQHIKEILAALEDTGKDS